MWLSIIPRIWLTLSHQNNNMQQSKPQLIQKFHLYTGASRMLFAPLSSVNTVQQVYGVSAVEASRMIYAAKSSCCASGEDKKEDEKAASSDGTLCNFYRGQFIHAFRQVFLNSAIVKLLADSVPNLTVRNMISAIATYPLETAYVKVASDLDGKYTSFFDALKKTVSEEGVLYLFRGVLLSVAEVTALRALYMKIVPFVHQPNTPVTYTHVVTATAAASVVVYPLDTIRRVAIAKKVSPVTAAKEIHEKSGILGFMSGVETRVIGFVATIVLSSLLEEYFGK